MIKFKSQRIWKWNSTTSKQQWATKKVVKYANPIITSWTSDAPRREVRCFCSAFHMIWSCWSKWNVLCRETHSHSVHVPAERGESEMFDWSSGSSIECIHCSSIYFSWFLAFFCCSLHSVMWKLKKDGASGDKGREWMKVMHRLRWIRWSIKLHIVRWRGEWVWVVCTPYIPMEADDALSTQNWIVYLSQFTIFDALLSCFRVNHFSYTFIDFIPIQYPADYQPGLTLPL